MLSFCQESRLRAKSWLLDVDDKWSRDPHYVFYDFNNPQEIPRKLHQSFDCVVIDPPFITHDVWDKYFITARLLLESTGHSH